jgi:hypothetical protein
MAKKTVKKTAKKPAKKPAKKKSGVQRALDNGWNGSSLPGHGSVFRRFFPNL